MRQLESRHLVACKPAEFIVLLRGAIDDVAVPRSHEPDDNVEPAILAVGLDYMRNRIAQLDVDDDAQLLVELPHQRRLGGLAIANVATKQVPHIRIPPTVRGAVTKQRTSVADKQSGDDGVHKEVNQPEAFRRSAPA